MANKESLNQCSIEELIDLQRPGYALDQRFYMDPAIYQLELERIFTKNWILAGHLSELSNQGDFKVVNVANDSAIIVRSDDGTIKAFANVCRHRGSLVCLQISGNCRKFTCPYHGWVYDINGNLTAARSMSKDFDKTKYNLHPVSVDVLHGLIFVCFSDKSPSLESAKKDLAEPMKIFDFENLKVAAKKDYFILANWKLSIENYQECYHCATAHPDYAKIHTLMVDRRLRKKLQKGMLEKMNACGIKDIELDFLDLKARPGEQGYAYGRSALFEGYKSGSKSGNPLAPLLGNIKDYDGGASDFTIGPFSFLLAYSDHVVAYVFTPTDQNNSRCEIYWLVRNDAEEGKDYDVDELVWLWDVTTKADKEIIANNRKGLESSFYKPGPFSRMEILESEYIQWILHELKG